LEAVASHRRSAWADAQRDLRRVETCVDPLSGTVALPCQRLRAQVTEAWALQFTFAAPTGGANDMRRPGFTGSVRAFVGEIRAQLSFDSPIARHALRLAAAVGVGTAAARITGWSQFYWIPVTVVMVLHPETAHTYTRCVRRVVGATAGVAAATAVMLLWHPDPLLAAALAVVSFGVTYSVAAMGHIPVSAALAVFIVFLIGTTETVDSAGTSQRIIATVLGGGLALASHVVMPDRSLVRLRQRASELLKAEVEYAATVIRAFVHPLDNADDMLSWVWLRTTRARSAFEASSGSVRADAPEVRKWLSSYRAALNAVTGACVTLEEQVAKAERETLDPQFVVAVEDYVDALRGDTPSQGQTWNVDARHLAEADQQLRDAATLLGKSDAAQRVLVAETETITRHLLAVESLTA
jgi:uncharacterized membrane protein YccC